MTSPTSAPPDDAGLVAMRERDTACAPTWFTGPKSAMAMAIRDRRDLLARIEALAQENANFRTWGTVEVAIRNPNVAEFMRHWEGRATTTEAERDQLRAEVARLAAQRDVATRGYESAVSHAQWQATTNSELNMLLGELRTARARVAQLEAALRRISDSAEGDDDYYRPRAIADAALAGETARETGREGKPAAYHDCDPERCPDCKELIIADDDDARVCIECGGMNRRAKP